MCKICSKLIIKILERRQMTSNFAHCPGASIAEFE